MAKIISKCNRDCFNCPFDDCINDRMTMDEFEAQNERDIEAREKPKQPVKDRKQYYHEYYMRNRERLNNLNRQYFLEHKEEIYLQRRAKKYSSVLKGVM